MIRVLQVIGKMDRAGAETMLMNIYRKIDRSKVQFDFLEFSLEKADYDDEIEKLGGIIYRLPNFTGYNYLYLKRKLVHFFRNHKYQVVHGHMGSLAPLYLKIAKNTGAYTIAHSHATNSNTFFERILYDLFAHNVRNIADYFMACSEQAGIDRFGERIVQSERFEIVKNGIDSVQYEYSLERHEELKRKYHMQDKVVYGHIGRFVASKNHQFLLEVFKEITCRDENVILLLIGRGGEENHIKRLAAQYGVKEKILFLGVRSDIPDLLNLMDAFVFPSLYEGLGIVGIEAQAAGLPCFFSEAIVDEAIITSHVWRYSLDWEAEKWADNILQIMSEFQRKDSVEDIKKAEFDIIDTTKKIEDFYCSVV